MPSDKALEREFERGYVIACCNLINMHGADTHSVDLFSALGITKAKIKRMNLTDYDMSALADLEQYCGADRMYGKGCTDNTGGGDALG